MAIKYNTSIVRSGLVLQLDAANPKSYSGSGTTWYDLSGFGNHFTINNTAGFTYNAAGYFDMTNSFIYKNSAITTNPTCTCVFWIKTTDQQSLFWSLYNNTSLFLGAYRVGNKFYNGGYGTPTYHQDTVQQANIYDYLIDGKWHMVEFKSVNLSAITSFAFSQYNTFIFETGSVSAIKIYNRNLTVDESKQNFEALRGRYSI